MKPTDNTITISILHREFKLICSKEEQAALQDAAELLNQYTTSVKTSGKIIDYDRILVISALNMSHDLLLCKNKNHNALEKITEQMQNLKTKIKSVLKETVT